MLLRPLDRILGSQSKVSLLRVLLRTAGPVSAREAARLAGLAHSGVRRALEDLTQMGIVNRTETTAQHLYTVNASNELVRTGLAPLFERERERITEVFGSVAEQLRPYLGDNRIRSMMVFGSAARGDDAPGSDFDLLVVTRSEGDVAPVHQHLVEAAPELFRRFGLSLSPVVISVDQLVRQADAHDGFVETVAREGRLIAGASIEHLLSRLPAEEPQG